MQTEITIALVSSGVLNIWVFLFTCWREKMHREDLADKDKWIEKLMDRLQSKTLFEYKVNQPKPKRNGAQRGGLSDAQMAVIEEDRLQEAD